MSTSAGLLLYRSGVGGVEVLLGHMGGPFWARKDEGAWSIPKGEYDHAAEDPRAAAAREFTEELGLAVPAGDWLDLDDVRYRGSGGTKTLHAWAIRGEIDLAAFTPGTFEMVWPPRSGRMATFPEIDRVAWFALADAAPKLSSGQRPLLTRLTERLANSDSR